MFRSISLCIRGNRIYEEHSLQSLRFVSASLRVLIMSENPLEDTTDYRICILGLLPKLERIDKDPVSQEERADALKRMKVMFFCDLWDKLLHCYWFFWRHSCHFRILTRFPHKVQNGQNEEVWLLKTLDCKHHRRKKMTYSQKRRVNSRNSDCVVK